MKIKSKIILEFEQDEILVFCDLFEFAINEGYELAIDDVKTIKGLISLDFVKKRKSDYPIIFERFACKK